MPSSWKYSTVRHDRTSSDNVSQDCSIAIAHSTKELRTAFSMSGRVSRDDKQMDAASRAGPVWQRYDLQILMMSSIRDDASKAAGCVSIPSLFFLWTSSVLSMEQISNGIRHKADSHNSNT